MFELVLALSIIGLVIQCTFIAVEKKEKYKLAALLKTVAALFFVAVAVIIGTRTMDKTYGTIVILGLIFGALGDLLHALRKIFPARKHTLYSVGTASFLIGHIMYVVALIPYSDDIILRLIIAIVLTCVLIGVLYSILNLSKLYKILGAFYCFFISLMVSFAMCNFIEAPRAATFSFALGALLFMISDIMLVINTFGGKKSFPKRVVLLVAYYLGQLFIAYSLFFF